jgi:putative transcriptional regulator
MARKTKMAKINLKNKKTDFGAALIESLGEVAAWKRGEVVVEVVNIPTISAGDIQAIRKKVARTAREFERRFGIPVATLNNWEQGRRQPDPAGRLLLRVIEAEPDVVARVAMAK